MEEPKPKFQIGDPVWYVTIIPSGDPLDIPFPDDPKFDINEHSKYIYTGYVEDVESRQLIIDSYPDKDGKIHFVTKTFYFYNVSSLEKKHHFCDELCLKLRNAKRFSSSSLYKLRQARRAKIDSENIKNKFKSIKEGLNAIESHLEEIHRYGDKSYEDLSSLITDSFAEEVEEGFEEVEGEFENKEEDKSIEDKGKDLLKLDPFEGIFSNLKNRK